MKVVPDISIITLTKNDEKGFQITAKSINEQKFKGIIEWIIIDGSQKKTIKKNLEFIRNFSLKSNLDLDHIIINHQETEKIGIVGIYQCMNYGLKLFIGKSIIFMNGGDSFYNCQSLDKLIKPLNDNNFKMSVSFGQAQIISKIGVDWFFPGEELLNIKNWLKFFEPNHQTFVVSRDLACNSYFIIESKISADKFWKRKMINFAENIFYIKSPVGKFYLEGYSSKRPNLKIVKSQINDKYISNLRKIIIFFKFLIPPFLYKFIPYLMKIKSKIVDKIF